VPPASRMATAHASAKRTVKSMQKPVLRLGQLAKLGLLLSRFCDFPLSGNPLETARLALHPSSAQHMMGDCGGEETPDCRCCDQHVGAGGRRDGRGRRKVAKVKVPGEAFATVCRTVCGCPRMTGRALVEKMMTAIFRPVRLC
jgi:hypothetical protein